VLNKYIVLKVRIVGYNQLLPVLHDLIDAKSPYSDILNKNVQGRISNKTKNDLFETLDLEEWTEQTPHTAILLDDAINILKDNKFKQLRDLLFQNRQPRVSIFICAQDMCTQNSVWLFAGMTDKIMFSMIMSQVSLSGRDWRETYNELNF
jgi:hypothetical protein